MGKQCGKHNLFFCQKMSFDFFSKLAGDRPCCLSNGFRIAGITGKAGKSRQLEGRVMFAGELQQVGMAFHRVPRLVLLRTSNTIVAMKTTSTSPLNRLAC